ncbi:hypothetical protein BZA77DRAFT_87634 [Pyronema omphalodes]|nr:hypothetical protein BZA77DRAFT_87634 [Pyronema omphalodes]
MNPLRPLLRSIPRRTLRLPIPHARPFHLSRPALGLAITNPQTDPETGATMMLDLTPRAISRLVAIREKDNNKNLALRLTVESGGCHGFQYTIGLSEEIDKEEDVVFMDEDSGVKVVLDVPSLELLKGSTVDYTKELIGSQFKVLNPAATSSCGCGTSFDIKV